MSWIEPHLREPLPSAEDSVAEANDWQARLFRESQAAGREPRAVGIPEWAPGARESVAASQENMRAAARRTYSLGFSLSEMEARRRLTEAKERARASTQTPKQTKQTKQPRQGNRARRKR